MTVAAPAAAPGGAGNSSGTGASSGASGSSGRWVVAVVAVVLLALGPLFLAGLLAVVALQAATAAGGCLPPGAGGDVTVETQVDAQVEAQVDAQAAGRMLPGLSAAPAVRAQQWANAAAVVQQGVADGVPVRGLVIAVMTARQESSLINVAHGDVAGPDSRGLFQQRAPWGPLAVRMSPRGAAHLFFTGGHGGDEPGLLDIPGWQTMPTWQAAQAVQRSAYPRLYARWQQLATTMVATLAPSGGPVAASHDNARVCAAVPGPGGWTVPMPPGSYTLTSPFGMRTLFGVRRMHEGQDLAAPVGTPVYAAAAGTVTFTGLASGYGNLVTIEHPDGTTTLYAHLSVIRARPGPIDAGAVLGLSGGAPGAPGSGRSTGPHLHFQIEHRGRPVDPVPWMRSQGAPL